MVDSTLDLAGCYLAGWSGIDVNNRFRLGDCFGLNRPHKVGSKLRRKHADKPEANRNLQG
jgi:hypothetical protein